MIPKSTGIATMTLERQPSLNYKMHFEKEKIYGYCDKLIAMQQVVYKILFTERYKHIIYSWNYGIELADLFGEPKSYVCPELERRITEALVQDDRIESVDSFTFDTSKSGIVHTFFVVHTIFGDLNFEREVKY